MVVYNTLANALTSIYNNEVRRKAEAIIYPSSNLVINVLRVMQKEGYVGEFEVIDDGRWGKIRVQLIGRINKCGPITPRLSIKYRELLRMPDYVRKYLPSKEIGTLILTTPKGVMSHRDAISNRMGGILLGYVY
jgi:ribosomal protein S8